jgi:hypothetical protein
MIKDVLVTLPAGGSQSFASNYAVTVARTFGAHLTGITIVQDVAGAGALFDWAPAIVLNEYRREVEAAAEAAKCGSRKCAAAKVRFDNPSSGRSGGRTFRGDDDRGSPAGIRSPDLDRSRFPGRGFKFDRVLICWDGSHNAARAIANAMPFVTRAKLVEVVTVATDRSSGDNMAGLCIAHHLARHDVIVEVRSIVAHGQDVSVRVRSHAAQHSADLIVGWLWSFVVS